MQCDRQTSAEPALAASQCSAGVATSLLLNPHAYSDTVVLLGSIGTTGCSEARPVFYRRAIAGLVSSVPAVGWRARPLCCCPPGRVLGRCSNAAA